MAFDIQQISTYSVLLPFLTALSRIGKIHYSFYPFLLIIFFGLINESISVYLIKQGISNAPPFNIFCFVEAVLVIWQFRNWNLFRQKSVANVFVVVLSLIWIAEISIGGINEFCSYFIMTSAFTITILSILMINRRIIAESRSLLKDPVLIISICFVMYFAYTLLVECFYINSNGKDFDFIASIQNIFSVTNLITNLLYTLAIVWIPTRLRFTLPY